MSRLWYVLCLLCICIYTLPFFQDKVMWKLDSIMLLESHNLCILMQKKNELKVRSSPQAPLCKSVLHIPIILLSHAIGLWDEAYLYLENNGNAWLFISDEISNCLFLINAMVRALWISLLIGSTLPSYLYCCWIIWDMNTIYVSSTMWMYMMCIYVSWCWKEIQEHTLSLIFVSCAVI